MPHRAPTGRPARRPGAAGSIERVSLLVALLLASAICAVAQEPPQDAALRYAIDQLRSTVGRWNVTTKFLQPDGSIAKTVLGTYEFSWVVPDRVIVGRSEIPELQQASGILFYVNEAGKTVEMASVGADGRLWIMTGPLDGEVRMTEEFKTQAGGVGRLRFTRSHVTADSFESRMEYTEDGGKTWLPGNHQLFRRAPAASPSSP